MDTTASESDGQTRASSDRRQHYRCRVDGARREGVLRVGDREIPAEITDESAGGFGVIVKGVLDFSVGQTLVLEHASGQTEVEVASMRLEESSDAAKAEDAADTPAELCTRLGLTRLTDIAPVGAEVGEHDGLSWEGVGKLALRLIPDWRALLGAAVLVAGIFVVGAALAWVMDRGVSEEVGGHPLDSRSAKSNRPTHWFDSHGQREATVPEIPDPKFAPPKPVARGSQAPRKAAPSRPAARATAASRPEDQPGKEATRLRNPRSLLKPAVAELLKLSAAQLDELRAILEETKTADYEGRSVPPQGGATAEPDAAQDASAGADPEAAQDGIGRRSLEILTEDQRRELGRLMSQTDLLDPLGEAGEPPVPPAGE